MLFQHFKNRKLLNAILGAAFIGLAAHNSLNADELREKLDKTFAANLNGLAAKCDQLKLPELAKKTRQWIIPRDPRRQYLFTPTAADPTRPPANASSLTQFWYRKFTEHRVLQAKGLFILARRALDAGDATAAYQLLHETLHENPNHAQARAILGYRKTNTGWEKSKGAITGKTMRIANRNLRFNAGRHWRVDSEHFTIITNASEKAGRQAAERLERLYVVWRQLFFTHWSSLDTLKRKFERPPAAVSTPKRHKIVLFANRQQYLSALVKLQPRIDVTVGIYMDDQRTVYLYAGDDAKTSTWYHEVAHQLFFETGRVVNTVGRQANFWLIEGIAMYMESPQFHDGYCTVGGIDSDRLQYARYRALSEKYYIPLTELTALGRADFQAREDLKRIYSQSAGLANFLSDYQGGVYRKALNNYLQAAYQGRATAGSLAQFTGQGYKTLDQQYKQFLDVTDADLAYLRQTPTAKKLALGHTQVSDQGLTALADHKELEWIDLTYTQTSDRGVQHLQNSLGMKHLVLEKTFITDNVFDVVDKMRQLEILDLTATRVTDTGLARVGRLSKLKELWIGGAQVTDASVPHILKLKQLETLDINATGITAQGQQRLERGLPKLKTEN